MKKVFLVAPSKAINSERLENAKKVLKRIGFLGIHQEDITEKYLHYAGTPKRRADEINRAYSNEDSDLIFAIVGGMGAVHLLNFLNYKKIKKSNKIFVGYSDITILLNAIYQKTKSRCLHGPNMSKNFKEYHKKTFLCLFDAINKKNYSVKIKEKDIFREGFVKAKITGGNLSLLGRSLGTPYEIDTRDKILFLEEVDLTERMIYDLLWQLKISKKFKRVKGVILGYFTNCGKEIEVYLKEFFKDFRCPVLMNQPIGHEEPNLTIPLGEECVIDTGKKFWGIKFSK